MFTDPQKENLFAARTDKNDKHNKTKIINYMPHLSRDIGMEELVWEDVWAT